jgi:hypothetical protein
MEEQDHHEKATENGPTEPVPDQAPSPGPVSDAKPAQAPAAPFTSSRPLYIPQFTAATQMILKRMKGEPSSLSAALSQASRSPSVTASIPSATYEDVKRRLVMGMNTTQMTMQMPAATPVRPSPTTLPAPVTAAPKSASSTVGMSAIRKVTAGLTGIPKSTLKAAAAKVVPPEPKIKKIKPPTLPRAGGIKRKRTQNHDDDDDANSTSSLAEQSEPETPAERATPTAPLTTTKSGRHVLKPTAYNPAAMDAASKKRPHYGKRTAEQALCKKCTRMHSPATNQMVFCDGCNEGWHQLCHEPWIVDDIVRDQTRAWFCVACQAKRDQESQAHPQKVTKKQRLEPKPRESWAAKAPQQKRAYLSTLPQQELVALLMTCLELHPDLPIFPGSPGAPDNTTTTTTTATPRSLFAGTTTEGLFPRADAHPTGQMNFVRKVTGGSNGSGKSVLGKGGRAGGKKEDSQERVGVNGGEEGEDGEGEEFDPLAPLWPKPGMGLYCRLPPDTGDRERLVDEGDFEAFSGIVYDERGRKVEENGMSV